MPAEEWQLYAQMLETVYDDLRRLDANAPILPEALAEQQPQLASGSASVPASAENDKDPLIVAHNQSLINAGLNPELENHKEFTRKYREIEISLQFHRAMAGTVREVLDAVLATPGDVADSEGSDSEGGEEEMVPEISQEVLVEF
jgi:hypothetical protein